MAEALLALQEPPGWLRVGVSTENMQEVMGGELPAAHGTGRDVAESGGLQRAQLGCILAWAVVAGGV